MDFQDLFDIISEEARLVRSQYQMTIREAIDALISMDAATPCGYQDGEEPGMAMSYRGYYSDLAFADNANVSHRTVGDVLTELQEVHGKTLEGYKGGDFTMKDDTVIWRSAYGSASGVAWMDIRMENGRAIIITKLID